MSWAPHPQARPDGSLRHLLTLDGLPRRHLEHLLRWAERYLDYLAVGAASTVPPGYDDAGLGPLFGSGVVPMVFDTAERPVSAADGVSRTDSTDGSGEETQDDRCDRVASHEPCEACKPSEACEACEPCEASFRDLDACVRAALLLGAEIGAFPALSPSVPLSSASRPTCAAHALPAVAPPARLIDWLPGVADARFLILRHPQNGAPFLLASHCAPNQQIINAGDGSYAFPIDALCIVLEILRHTSTLTERRVALVGDIAESAVARSILHALTTLGTPEIRMVGPTTLSHEAIAHLGATGYDDLITGLSDVDVVIELPVADTARPSDACRLPVIRFDEARRVEEGASRATPHTADMLRQAVWMAVFAVLAGCSDDDVGRVIGTARSIAADGPNGTTRATDKGGQ